ncbi:MAG: lamin tail domain-containing protein, partial [Verrucomicrobiota bacterium]
MIRLLHPGLIALMVTLTISGSARAEVVINEIHYHPAERGQPLEFIELLNAGPTEVDLSGWQFDRGIEWTFPQGTALGTNGRLLLAQDPVALSKAYKVQALGPWKGRLSNDGETLTLRDARGDKRDEVTYRAGFPWPAAADGGGASMELIHPNTDNDLAGAWRSSRPPEDTKKVQITFVPPASTWRFLKGTGPPSKPFSAWTRVRFSDAKWSKGKTPIGYSDNDDNTVLRDMESRYNCVFLRHTFTCNQVPTTPLLLRVYSDDGAVVWLNGREIARLRVRQGRLSHRTQTTRNHEAAWEEIVLTEPGLLQKGANVLAVQGVNGNPDSSDFSIDAVLKTAPPEWVPFQPSPGGPNLSAAKNPPPMIRQVGHRPEKPRPGQPVTIQAKVTDPDGVASVVLHYQNLHPGGYLTADDPAFATNWTSVAMIGQDDVYTATLPAELHQHRHLYRYRIEARDNVGQPVTVPYADDAQKNFAYFCYGEVPAWSGADRPGRTPVIEFGRDLMNNSLPIVHLLAKARDVENSQYQWSHNEQYLKGTLIINGEVFDHIRFRNRGETTTYAVGKNKWRFNFNRTHELNPAILDGGNGKRRWKRFNLNPGTTPYHPDFRGTGALNERLAFRLYDLAGL